MSDAAGARPSLAVVALAAILAITAAWWALALWPLPAEAPAWLVLTREVCFGATRDSLPHAGGWLLLIGEPLGMLAVLVIVWRDELREGLARFHRRFTGRAISATVVLLLASGLLAAGRRVSTVRRLADGEPFAVNAELPARSQAPAPPLTLIDQLGGRTRLESYRGRWVMVTFAFGHCEDICPVIVQHARRARVDEGVDSIPLLVVSLDPWRDTPDRLATIAAAWELGPHDRLLSGDVASVNAALDDWRIPRQRDPDTGMIAHGSTIVLVDPDGREAWRIEGAPQRARAALALVRDGMRTAAR